MVGILELDGRLRLTLMERVTATGLEGALLEIVARSARLCTDEANAYTQAGRAFEGGHETVCHKWAEYARGDVTMNGIEGAFCLLKRGMYATFHSVSKEHLQRYLAQSEFRHDTRRMDDSERVAAAIRRCEGKWRDVRAAGGG